MRWIQRRTTKCYIILFKYIIRREPETEIERQRRNKQKR